MGCQQLYGFRGGNLYIVSCRSYSAEQSADEKTGDGDTTPTSSAGPGRA